MYEYRLVLVITNTHLPMRAAWVQERIGGSLGPHSRSDSRKLAWQIVLCQARAASFTRLSRPYLIVKAAQAERALRFVDESVSHKGLRALSLDELGRREHSNQQSLELNGGTRSGRPRKRRD